MGYWEIGMVEEKRTGAGTRIILSSRGDHILSEISIS